MTLKIRFINQSFFPVTIVASRYSFFIFCLVELYRLELCFRKWKRQGRIIFLYRDDLKCIVFYCTAATLFLVLANHYGHDKEINKRINRSIRIAVWVIGSPLGPPQNKSNQKASGSPSTISVFQPQDPMHFSCVPVLTNCLQVVTTACFFAECVAVSDETCCNDDMKVK